MYRRTYWGMLIWVMPTLLATNYTQYDEYNYVNKQLDYIAHVILMVNRDKPTCDIGITLVLEKLPTRKRMGLWSYLGRKIVGNNWLDPRLHIGNVNYTFYNNGVPGVGKIYSSEISRIKIDPDYEKILPDVIGFTLSQVWEKTNALHVTIDMSEVAPGTAVETALTQAGAQESSPGSHRFEIKRPVQYPLTKEC